MGVTLYLSLLEEHRLRVFENRMLSKVLGLREDVTGNWKKLIMNRFMHRTAYHILLTPWGRVLQTLTVTRPVEKFPVWYRSRRFIIVFTTTRH
jgi:hypothetical protein